MMIKHIKAVFVTASLLLSPFLVAEPLTPNQLHATLGIVTNFILDDGIQFHGKSYKAITSPHTGRVWLDRNIGASKKCTSYDDAQCYGNYFQWGRAYDGHESSVDSTTVLATDINNAGAEYIRGNADWASTDLSYGNARATNWLKTDGSTVCPVGYRVPLRSELDAEVGDISNKETAYANFLKFPATGYRNYNNGNYSAVGTWGTVWSISSTLHRASYFRFYSASDWNDVGVRAWGLSVRCIKHEGEQNLVRDDSKEVVYQINSGLMWQDDVAAETVTKRWLTPAKFTDCSLSGFNCENTSGDTAASYCTALNLGGYDDWRLPTKEELFGIVKSDATNPSISAVFQHTASAFYWSSTTWAGGSSFAWRIFFYSGFQGDDNKNYSNYVRCVRAGQ